MMIFWLNLLPLMSESLACGGLFHAEESLAVSPAQEIILSTNGMQTTVEYLIEYEGDVDSFGWVIPIFGEIAKDSNDDPMISDGDFTLFSDYRSFTQPNVIFESGSQSSGGGGCGCGSSSKDGFGAADDGLEIIDTGVTGTYSYTIINAESSEALSDWLSTNGWTVGAAAPAIESYVAEDDVYFVAIKLSNVSNDDTVSNLPPIKITTESSNLRYPARMLRNSDNDEIRTRVYVVGDQQASVSNWESESLQFINGRLGTDEPLDLYDEKLRNIGGPRAAFAMVYSGEYTDSTWITRYDSITEPSAHSIDPTFILDAGNDESQLEIELTSDGSGSTSQGLIALPLLLLGFGAYRRKF